MKGNTKVVILAVGLLLIAVGWFVRNGLVSSGRAGNTTVSLTDSENNKAQSVIPTSIAKEVTTNAPIPNVTVPLLVSAPVEGLTVKSATTVVKGKTAKGIDVFVNDTEVRSDGNGNFSATVSLDEGENTIIVVVTDNEGNVAEETVTVIYDSGN